LEGFATIKAGGKRVLLKMNELECATMVVFRHGYDDIDVEPTGNGDGVTVTATGQGKATVKVSGKTLEAACERLVNNLVGG
jgi:hypothetical protein